jgi:hypothetical protein
VKILVITLLLLVVHTGYTQTLPTEEEIFVSLYGSHYNPATKRATWRCPQESDAAPDGCAFVGDSTSVIELLQRVVIDTGESPRAYVITNAGSPGGCHGCAPLLGFGVFRFRDSRWQLESKNVDMVRFGSSGEPGNVDLVKIGPDLYGFMLTHYDGNGGYFSTSARLLAPKGNAIPEVWNGILDEDNEGAYDPTDKFAAAERIHVDAAYRFLYNGESDHNLFQVISQGYGYGRGSTYHSRNLVQTFRFVNDRYELPRPSVKKGSKRIRP